MTVTQLRILLSQLPDECQQWPVMVDVGGDERSAAGLILLPPLYASSDCPDGCVTIASWVSPVPPARDIRIYRPPVGPAAG